MGLSLFTLACDAVAVIVGIVVHESSHALAAFLLGDRTARSRGRISLNPLAHVDLFGTILLPLLMVAIGAPAFAFAKPVPIYLGNLKHPKRDEVLISLAGPASNLLLAGLAALTLRIVTEFFGTAMVSNGAIYTAISAAGIFMQVNLSLCFFNLIPLPPLDGSSVLVTFLKGRALDTYYRVQQYSMPILILVLYLIPRITGIDVVGMYFDVTVYPLAMILMRFALSIL